MHVRNGDIVMTVAQDNAGKSLTITQIDESKGTTDAMIGLSSATMKMQDFRQFLPPHITENIADYLEFEDGGNDLVSVLRRTRRFALTNAENEAIEMNMRIEHAVSDDGLPHYLLVMGSKSLGNDECLKKLQDLLRTEESDPLTGLATGRTFTHAMEQVHPYITQRTMVATIAIIRIDNLPQLRRQMTDKDEEIISERTALRLKQVLRGADVIAHLGDGYFAAGLLKTAFENAHIPLNRLFKTYKDEAIYVIDDHSPLSLSAAYHELTSADQVNEVILRCQESLQANATNAFALIKA